MGAKKGRPALHKDREGRKIQLSFWATEKDKEALLSVLPRDLVERTKRTLSNEVLLKSFKAQVERLEQENEELANELEWLKEEKKPLQTQSHNAPRPEHCGKPMSFTESAPLMFRGKEVGGNLLIRQWSCECGHLLVDQLIVDF